MIVGSHGFHTREFFGMLEKRRHAYNNLSPYSWEPRSREEGKIEVAQGKYGQVGFSWDANAGFAGADYIISGRRDQNA